VGRRRVDLNLSTVCTIYLNLEGQATRQQSLGTWLPGRMCRAGHLHEFASQSTANTDVSLSERYAGYAEQPSITECITLSTGRLFCQRRSGRLTLQPPATAADRCH